MGIREETISREARRRNRLEQYEAITVLAHSLLNRLKHDLPGVDVRDPALGVHWIMDEEVQYCLISSDPAQTFYQRHPRPATFRGFPVAIIPGHYEAEDTRPRPLDRSLRLMFPVGLDGYGIARSVQRSRRTKWPGFM